MYDIDWISFLMGFIVALFAAVFVSDLVFPNDKLEWGDDDDNI